MVQKWKQISFQQSLVYFGTCAGLLSLPIKRGLLKKKAGWGREGGGRGVVHAIAKEGEKDERWS